MSREFVDAIISNNNVEAEKAFTSSVSTKVGDALEVKRKDMSKTFVSNYTDQESDVNKEE